MGDGDPLAGSFKFALRLRLGNPGGRSPSGADGLPLAASCAGATNMVTPARRVRACLVGRSRAWPVDGGHRADGAGHGCSHRPVERALCGSGMTLTIRLSVLIPHIYMEGPRFMRSMFPAPEPRPEPLPTPRLVHGPSSDPPPTNPIPQEMRGSKRQRDEPLKGNRRPTASEGRRRVNDRGADFDQRGLMVNTASKRPRLLADRFSNSRAIDGVRQKERDLSRSTPEERHQSSESRMNRIAHRAHEVCEARGGAHGTALEDWLQAEREIDSDCEP